VNKLNVRFKDDAGRWGVPRMQQFQVVPPTDVPVDPAPPIAAAEYFIGDADPGVGHGTAITVAPGDAVDFDFIAATTGLAPGAYKLSVRFKDADGHWGFPRMEQFQVVPPTDVPVDPAPPIAAAEYFIGSNDPGVGQGTAIAVVPGDAVGVSFIAETDELPPGEHLLAVRFKDADGRWGFPRQRLFIVDGVRLTARVMLGGPFDPGTGLMHDSLRAHGLVPLTEPYTGLGHAHAGGGGDEATTADVLAATGSSAIVDWVMIELRDKTDATQVLATRAALVQRDGTVVDVDGSSPVRLWARPDEHHVVVRHRNHLGVMTAGPVMLTTTATGLDLTQAATPTYGTAAQDELGGTLVLWPGDAHADGAVRYTGGSNDRDPVLSFIGGAIPTSTVAAYANEDLNLDGLVRYTGAGNDRDIILQTVGGTVPTATRTEQVP
ncbi:MAG: hypothetical protein RBT71_09405, partial [Flavobacteriales bacterium]|jgi:hypothetical protein|nr:hypothetical protein [Flavobacteriales bacterium]